MHMTSIFYNVLFLCTTNSARSILAESILLKEGSGLFKPYSAGSKPKGELNQFSLDILRKFDFNADGYVSKNWDIFDKPDAPKMDFIITVCDDAAKEICPVKLAVKLPAPAVQLIFVPLVGKVATGLAPVEPINN